MLISGCLIVKNEAELLRGCLQSMVDYVDELIVVDNGSTDETQAIAREFTDQIIYVDDVFQDEGRNAYLNAAKYPWIFILDADERITPEGGQALRQAAAEAADEVMGLALPRFEYFGSGKWARSRFFRLYRSHPLIRYNTNKIHSTPVIAMKQLGKLGEAYVPIHHFDGLLPDRSAQKRTKAIAALRKEVDGIRQMSEGVDTENQARLHNYLGQEYVAVGRYAEAEQEYKAAIEVDADDYPRARIALAQLYLIVGDLAAAEREGKILLPILDFDIALREQVPVVLADVAARQGKVAEAIEICARALERNAFSPHMHINMAALLEDREPERAIEHLKTALALNPYLVKPMIYLPGEPTALFKSQSGFLACTRTIYEHFEHCWNKVGNADLAAQWRQAGAAVQAVSAQNRSEALFEDFAPAGAWSAPLSESAWPSTARWSTR